MESRWHFFPGQTLETTKVSDRVHALHMNKTTWAGITKHLDRTKLMQEAAEKEAAVKRYLDEGSKKMTEKWENSLENVRKRKKEERQKMIEEKKNQRQQKFLEIRKEQEEIRRKYMEKVKKQLFMTTGHARDLTSALIATEVSYERTKQVEFHKKIKEHEKEEQEKIAENVRRGAKQELIEKEEEKKVENEKKKKYSDMLKQTIEEKQKLRKMVKEQKAKTEQMELKEAFEEQEKLNKIIAQEKFDKKKELYEEKKKYFVRQKELEQQRIKEEKELDEVVEIYKQSKDRIDCMRKQKEQEMRDEVLERQDKITALLKSGLQSQFDSENKMLKNAIEEIEAADLERLKAKKEFNEKMKRERIENLKEVQAKAEERKQKEIELKKWELLNRYKVDEFTKKYDENKKREMWQEVLKYRQELCEQMEDNRMEKEREKAIEIASFKSRLEEDDAKFFEYANEVLELAKKKGRSTIPIDRVITKYLKEMNLDPSSFGLNVESKSPNGNKTKELAKKVIKPRQPRHCRCYCPKR